MARARTTLSYALVPPDPLLSIDWSQVEKAYGHQLPTDVRDRVLAATFTYLAFAPFEQEAETTSEVERRIEHLQGMAEALFGHLTAPPSDSAAAAHAMLDGPINVLTKGLLAFNAACGEARAGLATSSVKQASGQHWNEWIRNLTAVLRLAGLPTGAGKTEGVFPASDFTRLIEALQILFPKADRKHGDMERDSLVQAIHRARRDG